MFIALTGLHAAGKSYLSNNIMPEFGFCVCSKKELVKFICKKVTGRDDWDIWYREEFNKDAENITRIILSYLDLNKNIVLDAVHSDLEWKIIKSIIPNAELVGVITPEYIRAQRREDGDIEKDEKRIGYWHNGGGCLMTQVSWTLNGGASLEINKKMFEEFLTYVQNKENSIQGEKKEKLVQLIRENAVLTKKIDLANKLLNEYLLQRTEESEKYE